MVRRHSPCTRREKEQMDWRDGAWCGGQRAHVYVRVTACLPFRLRCRPHPSPMDFDPECAAILLY